MLTLLAGLGLGLSLIVAIGAQNVFVLRQGIRREHVLWVVIICAVSDALLIVAGVAGLGYLVSAAPWLVTVARWAGAAFLFVYAVMAARRAWRGGEALSVETTDASDATSSTGAGTATLTRAGTRLAPVILTTLALTWLNPHVYLDTVLMLGSIAATHGENRWLFAAGAIVASIVWFTALGFGARYVGRWLRTERSWRVLDAVIALVMLTLAVSLVLPVMAG
ncbi:amino acid transporter [Microbacterium esteraromaticum]|uniref:Amino acid transporter n=1 Tax=Microbacterium esteraromaticum TaxID=57043 RepID=A0A7D8AHU8_9MICO|nr:LysE/ArgO family amino acid transporter [Microbacterium esteraromaticum]QMU96106.1 amino acid transporter [Microbacterium esteraromaticum]